MVQEANTTVTVDEQVYRANLYGAGNDAQEKISGPVPGGNTTEVSTFAYDGQVYGEDLSGIAKVPAYLLPGNVEGEISGPVPESTADASTFAINGQVYGGLVYREDLSGVAKDPEYFLPGIVEQGLGDWAQCSSNSQCSNGCCSNAAVADVFICTPLSGDFNPSICTAV